MQSQVLRSAQSMTGHPTHLAPERSGHRAGLVLIAAYKLMGALLFILVGVGALRLLHKDIDDLMWHTLVEVMHRNPESRVVNFILERAQLVDDPLLKRIGFFAFLYAALGIVEAMGLYLEKTWAEFLTIVITASFLPIEIHELMRRLTWMRVSILTINVAVLLYLLFILGERARTARVRRAAEKAEPAA